MKMITAAALMAIATLTLTACDGEPEGQNSAETQETVPEETGVTQTPRPSLCADEDLGGPECVFAETIRDQVLADHGGILDHGVEPAFILASFPGIQPSDLDGMPVAQGAMALKGGTLVFQSDGTPLTSGATALTPESYQVIFRRLKARTGLHPATGEHGYDFAMAFRQPR